MAKDLESIQDRLSDITYEFDGSETDAEQALEAFDEAMKEVRATLEQAEELLDEAQDMLYNDEIDEGDFESIKYDVEDLRDRLARLIESV